MKRLSRGSYTYEVDPSLPPVLEVEPGESFWVETLDAHRGTVVDERIVYQSLEDAMSRLGGANPVSGPIALRGARAGDCLEVTVEEIVPAPRTQCGYTCTTARVDPSLAAESVICPIDGDEVVLPLADRELRLLLRPMIGTLGLALAEGSRPSFAQHPDVLGNIDVPELGAGGTVVLRAQVEGGLLFLGDAHLAQGDAEIHRAAIEAEADVRLSIRISAPDTAGLVDLPQLNTAAFIGSIATGPGTLDDHVRSAFRDLALRLSRFYGFTLADGYRLLGAAGRITVGQLVPPLASVLAWLSRRYLP